MRQRDDPSNRPEDDTLNALSEIEILMQRGQLCLNDGNWWGAHECFDRVLEVKSQFGRAYAGKLCADFQVSRDELLSEFDVDREAKRIGVLPQKIFLKGDAKFMLEQSGSFTNAVSYSSPESAAEIMKYAEIRKKSVQRERLMDQWRRAFLDDEFNLCFTELAEAKFIDDVRRPTETRHEAVTRIWYKWLWEKTHTAQGTDWRILAKYFRKMNGYKNTIEFSEKCERRYQEHIIEMERARQSIAEFKNILAVQENAAYVLDADVGAWVYEKRGGFVHCRYQEYAGKIVSVAAFNWHCAFLKNDGTVFTRRLSGVTGNDKHDTRSWQSIVAIAVGGDHIVGLKEDGAVCVAGNSEGSECGTEAWSDITAIAATYGATVGLRANGTMVFTESRFFGAMDVWNGIVSICSNSHNVVGLRLDGTVVSTDLEFPTEKVRNVIAISSGDGEIICLHADGTVSTIRKKSVKKIESWSDVVTVAISNGDRASCIGLTRDGTLLVAPHSAHEADFKKAAKSFGMNAKREEEAERARNEERDRKNKEKERKNEELLTQSLVAAKERKKIESRKMHPVWLHAVVNSLVLFLLPLLAVERDGWWPFYLLYAGAYLGLFALGCSACHERNGLKFRIALLAVVIMVLFEIPLIVYFHFWGVLLAMSIFASLHLAIKTIRS